ncbi:type II toxin-antitoxin system RelE/ParE family toxin [Wenyingzhuangia sp. 1_MG-2023]|nr:type II toxin-antitoxin system RelE/ParE family toxin [Wenyingzhuangia sp. 1_MG-2023]
MSRTVIISKTAEKKLKKLFEFLLENWNQKVKSDFIKKLDKNINLIKINPESFPQSENKVGLHKCVITKQTTLFYRHTSKIITIVTIFDTRQNPNKLKKEI